MTDRLTLLRCEPGRRAAKLVRGDGTGGAIVEGYDAGAWFGVYELAVDGLGALAAAVEAVSLDPWAFVVRGEPLPGIDRGRCRRLLHRHEDGAPPTFRDVPRRWLMLDFDGLDAPALFDPLDGEVIGHWLRARLPAAFAGASFWWQMTASAGLKPGVRCRLAFWLDRPAGGGELGRGTPRLTMPCSGRSSRSTSPGPSSSACPTRCRCGAASSGTSATP